MLINSWDLDIWGRETGNPEAKCMFPALFARWLLKNNEAFKARGAKFIHNAPYVLAHLAGLKAKDMFIDWGAMSGWGMGYKVEEKCWSPEQLKILGIEASMMPKIVKPWDIVGHLTEEMAEKTGLAAGTPICGGGNGRTHGPQGGHSHSGRRRRHDAVHAWQRQYGSRTGCGCGRHLFYVLRFHKRHYS